MAKDLPKVFANKIDHQFDNVQEYYYKNTTFKNEDRSVPDNIEHKINQIFSASNFVYKKHVVIDTYMGVVDKVIVGKTNNALLTMDNEVIYINDIKNIRVSD